MQVRELCSRYVIVARMGAGGNEQRVVWMPDRLVARKILQPVFKREQFSIWLRQSP